MKVGPPPNLSLASVRELVAGFKNCSHRLWPSEASVDAGQQTKHLSVWVVAFGHFAGWWPSFDIDLPSTTFAECVLIKFTGTCR